MKTKVVGSLIFLGLFQLSSIGAEQDNKVVSGIITSFRNYPLNNVKVLSSKTGESVNTDKSGVFSVKCQKGDLLVISASGFESQEVKVKRKDLYNIDLIYIDSEANFNKATTNGHISADILSKALADKVNSNKRDYSKYNSIYQLISSEIYDVRVKGNTIVNTKIRSLDSSPPVLLVVDDRIVPDISFVDPSWVKSIELIDDVRTTMYGSMGANGVLRIVLK